MSYYIPQESERLFHYVISRPLDRWTGAAGKVAPPAGQILWECLGKINQDHGLHPQEHLQGHDKDHQSNIVSFATTPPFSFSFHQSVHQSNQTLFH